MVDEAAIEGCREELLRQEAHKETVLNGCKRRRLELRTVRMYKKRGGSMSTLGSCLETVGPDDWGQFVNPPRISDDDDSN